RSLPARRKRYWLMLTTSAAAIMILWTAGNYFLRQEAADPLLTEADMAAISPGTNKALLTLADGTTVDLSSLQDGIIVGDDGITYSDGTEVLDDRQQTTDNRQAAEKESSGSGVSRLMSIKTPKG